MPLRLRSPTSASSSRTPALSRNETAVRSISTAAAALVCRDDRPPDLAARWPGRSRRSAGPARRSPYRENVTHWSVIGRPPAGGAWSPWCRRCGRRVTWSIDCRISCRPRPRDTSVIGPRQVPWSVTRTSTASRGHRRDHVDHAERVVPVTVLDRVGHRLRAGQQHRVAALRRRRRARPASRAGRRAAARSASGRRRSSARSAPRCPASGRAGRRRRRGRGRPGCRPARRPGPAAARPGAGANSRASISKPLSIGRVRRSIRPSV